MKTYNLNVLDIACMLMIAGFTGAFIGVQYASWYLTCSCH
jgi:hypothetical protein